VTASVNLATAIMGARRTVTVTPATLATDTKDGVNARRLAATVEAERTSTGAETEIGRLLGETVIGLGVIPVIVVKSVAGLPAVGDNGAVLTTRTSLFPIGTVTVTVATQDAAAARGRKKNSAR